MPCPASCYAHLPCPALPYPALRYAWRTETRRMGREGQMHLPAWLGPFDHVRIDHLPEPSTSAVLHVTTLSHNLHPFPLPHLSRCVRLTALLSFFRTSFFFRDTLVNIFRALESQRFEPRLEKQEKLTSGLAWLPCSYFLTQLQADLASQVVSQRG